MALNREMITRSNTNGEEMGAQQSSLTQTASTEHSMAMDIDDREMEQRQKLAEDTLEAQIASLKSGLQEKDQKIQNLQLECEDLNRLIDEKDEDAAKFRKLWKNTGRELNKFRANGQGFYQAFVWRVVVKEVFNKFEWVGRDYSQHFRNLREGLRPSLDVDPETGLSRSDPEAERKFQTWTATTTAMFLEKLDSKRVDADMKARITQHVDYMVNTIHDLIRRDQEKGLKEQLYTIISQAFELDKEISRQVGRVNWRFKDPQQMEKGDPVQNSKQIGLVVAPAVWKKGKSTGDDFHQETRLLEREVSYRSQGSGSEPNREARA
ncbi:hypothetical protein ACHAPA_008798 [Fusarium lateritium]